MLRNKYIHHENQTLLWNTINKSMFIDILHHSVRANWFKETIEYMYLDEVDKYNDLKQLNKKTIEIMIFDLAKRLSSQHALPPAPPAPPEHSTSFPNLLKKDISEMNSELFNQKQKEYTDNFDSRAPPEIDFRMKEIDEPIEDISILVKKHLKEREEDVLSGLL